MSQFFASGGQTIGVSASASVLPMGSPIFPSGCEGKLGVALESLRGKTPIVWPPDAKNQLNGKDPDAGKIEGRSGRAHV